MEQRTSTRRNVGCRTEEGVGGELLWMDGVLACYRHQTTKARIQFTVGFPPLGAAVLLCPCAEMGVALGAPGIVHANPICGSSPSLL